MYFVRRAYPHLEFSRTDVASVVKNCSKCLSIDPALICWPVGNLSVESNSSRVAIDVTHFLSIIDCGPSRYGSCYIMMMRLMNNGTSFRSSLFHAMLRKWDI